MLSTFRAAVPPAAIDANAAPLKWNDRAPRGGHRLPADRPVEVAAFGRKLVPGWPSDRYRFTGGVAQALRGIEVLVERDGPEAPEAVLARIGAQLDQVPAALTGNLRQIIVYNRQDEFYDRFWERQHGIPGFQAVAAGGEGQVTFFGGRPYTDGVLFHEVAHSLPVSTRAWSEAGAKDNVTLNGLAKSGTLRPRPFEDVPDAARRERWTPRLAPGSVTAYGATAAFEDVAEAMRLLLSERHYGHAFGEVVAADGTVRDLPFSAVYPARTRVLETTARADLDGDGTIG